MKRHTLVLAAITVLALAVMSCGVQFVGSNPTPQNFNQEHAEVQEPQPGTPQGPDTFDSGPQNGNQGPESNPNGQNPGEGNIVSFTADRTALNPGECTMLHWETQGGFGAKLNSQPVPPVGQQQVCPPQATVYTLGLDIGSQMLTSQVTITVNGRNQAPQLSNPTKPPKNKPGGVTPASPLLNITAIAVVANLDLAISNIYPSSTGHIMVTVKNTGNVNISGSYKVSCSGYYIDSGGNNALKLTGQYAKVDLTPGKSKDFDTGYSRNPSIQKMFVQCTLTPPQGDTNKGNDSMGPTQVK